MGPVEYVFRLVDFGLVGTYEGVSLLVFFDFSCRGPRVGVRESDPGETRKSKGLAGSFP